MVKRFADKITLGRSIVLEQFGERERELWRQFLKEHKFRLVDASEDAITARRGSLWGNLTSFNAQDLRAELKVVWFNGVLDCLLTVNCSFQLLSEWDHAFYAGELVLAEALLVQGELTDLDRTQWDDLNKGRKKAAFRYLLYGGGLKMTNAQRFRFFHWSDLDAAIDRKAPENSAETQLPGGL